MQGIRERSDDRLDCQATSGDVWLLEMPVSACDVA